MGSSVGEKILAAGGDRAIYTFMSSKFSLALAFVCLGTVVGCGKKRAATSASPAPQAAAPAEAAPMPVATPREYLVNGQIDLNAISATLKEYIDWQQTVVMDPSVMVTSGFIKSLPPPPPGKKYFVDGMTRSTTVQLVPLSAEELKRAKSEPKKSKP